MTDRFPVNSLARCCRGALVMVLLVAGCHQPTAEDRDNRRLLEQILTAVTLSNARLVDEEAKRAQQRHDGGMLSDEDFQALDAILGKARAGDWSGAAAAGYAFRKQRPFVGPGQ